MAHVVSVLLQIYYGCQETLQSTQMELQNPSFPTQCRSVARRWLRSLLLVTCGAVGALLVHPVLDGLAKGVDSYARGWSPTGIGLGTAFILVSSGWILHRLSAWRFSHAPYLLYYPSTLIPAVVAALFYSWLRRSVTSQPVAFGSGVMLPAAIGAVLATFTITSFATDRWEGRTLARTKPRRAPTTDKAATDIPPTLEDPRQLFSWLERNEAIEDDRDDFFGFHRAADRVALRLSQTKRVAFAGPFGSGKTSLRIMVERRLASEGIWVCAVDGWGTDSADAPSRVLGAAVATLSRHVDCLQLAGLPKAYQAAMKASGSKVVLAATEAMGDSPAEALLALDEVLSAVNRTLVIFIEDLDRANAETLTRVAALLDRLRALTRVTFVLSVDATLAGSMDLLRLCDYVEPMPTLGSKSVRPVLAKFLEHCRDLFDDIDPAAPDSRPRWTTKKAGGGNDIDLAEMFEEHPPAQLVQLARLLDTPRKLKTALRHTHFAWRRLHGEVELLDLLMAMALRVGAPEAYAFAVDNTERIRRIPPTSFESSLSSGSSKEKTEARRQKLRTEFQRIAERSRWDAEAADATISYLFEGWREDRAIPPIKSPQSVDEREPTDYWRRIVVEDVDGLLSDQQLLQALARWQAGDDITCLPSLLVRHRSAPAMLEHFERMVRSEDVLPLASRMFQVVLERDGCNAGFDGEMANTALWRLAIKKHPERVGSFVAREIQRAVPRSLKLALEIAYFWTSDRTNLLTQRQATRVGRYLAAQCQRSLRTPESWCNALGLGTSDRDAYTLAHLIRYPIHGDHLLYATPLWCWDWAIPLLIEAAARKPAVICPMLALLVSRSEGDRPEDKKYFVDETFLRALVPDVGLRRRFLQAVVTETSLDGIAVYAAHMVRNVRVDARRILG